MVRTGKSGYRKAMRFLTPLLICVTLVALSGCFRSPPYVLNPNEFNRDSPDYAEGPKDVSNFTICYNKRGATPKEVQKMAVNHCAEYKKTVDFIGQNYQECPLATPVGARFVCRNTPPVISGGGGGESKKQDSSGPFYYSP